MKQENSFYLLQKNQLQTKVEELLNKICKLENDKKDIEIENMKLNEKITEFEMSNIDENNYQNWSSKQFAHWICSLNNGELKQYKNEIIKTFINDEIDGSCIDDIDAADIKLWNIGNFKQRKLILNNIKLLKNNKNIKNNNNNGNEGSNAPTAYL